MHGFTTGIPCIHRALAMGQKPDNPGENAGFDSSQYIFVHFIPCQVLDSVGMLLGSVSVFLRYIIWPLTFSALRGCM